MAFAVRRVQNKSKRETKEPSASEYNEIRSENNRLKKENKRLRRELEKRFEAQYDVDEETQPLAAASHDKKEVTCPKCESIDLTTFKTPTSEIRICKNCQWRAKK